MTDLSDEKPDLATAIRQQLDYAPDTGDGILGMQRALYHVLDRHRPTTFGYADGDRYHGQPPDCSVCEEAACVSAWPCDTVRDIARALGIVPAAATAAGQEQQ